MTLIILCGVLFAADLAIVFYFRDNYFRAAVMLTCVYLVSLTLAKEMDITFSVYFLFLFFVLLRAAEGLPRRFLLYGLYLLPYVFTGLFFQETMNTASVLLTRYGFLLLGLLQCELRLPESFRMEEDIPFALRWGTATELLLAVYLLLRGDLEGRLTMNHQAVGGSISIGLILLILAFYFHNQELWMRNYMWLYLAVNLLIIILSGTRGYFVIAGLALLPFIWNFFMDRRYFRIRWLAAAVMLWLFCLLLLLGSDEIWSYVVRTLRLNESIGYRVYENAFIKMLYQSEPWYHKILGFGLGGRANHLPETIGIAWEAVRGAVWMVPKLLTETTCHNYWYTILFKQGTLGLFVCGFVIFCFFRKLFVCRNIDSGVYHTLLFFGIGILISLTYRISSTCGVFEVLVLLWSSEMFGEKLEIRGESKPI